MGADWSVRGLPFPLTLEVKEKIGLNDEYEEYAIHDYELPFTVDEMHFHWQTQSAIGNVSELPENYNRISSAPHFQH